MRITLLVLVAFVAAALALPSGACPFCARLGKTLGDAMTEADVVVFASPSANADGALTLRQTIKGPAEWAEGMTLTVTRDLSASGRPRIVFAQRVEGKIDPYRIMVDNTGRLANYLRDVATRADAPADQRLARFFSYLEDDDPIIAEDAYKEFAKADFVDVRQAKSAYKPGLLIAWIDRPATPAFRIGLYGLLLGMTGGADAKQHLSEWCQRDDARFYVGLDGLLAGWSLVDREPARERTLHLLLDPSSSFAKRYPALQTIKFLLDETKDDDAENILVRLETGVSLDDIGDLIIDELRKRNRWNPTDKIVARARSGGVLNEKMLPAILRYCLRSPTDSAQRFLAEMKKNEPARVSAAEQALKFEDSIHQQMEAERKQRSSKPSL